MYAPLWTSMVMAGSFCQKSPYSSGLNTSFCLLSVRLLSLFQRLLTELILYLCNCLCFASTPAGTLADLFYVVIGKVYLIWLVR